MRGKDLPLRLCIATESAQFHARVQGATVLGRPSFARWRVCSLARCPWPDRWIHSTGFFGGFSISFSFGISSVFFGSFTLGFFVLLICFLHFLSSLFTFFFVSFLVSLVFLVYFYFFVGFYRFSFFCTHIYFFSVHILQFLRTRKTFLIHVELLLKCMCLNTFLNTWWHFSKYTLYIF